MTNLHFGSLCKCRLGSFCDATGGIVGTAAPNGGFHLLLGCCPFGGAFELRLEDVFGAEFKCLSAVFRDVNDTFQGGVIHLALTGFGCGR